MVIEAVQLRWDNWSEMCAHAKVGQLIDGQIVQASNEVGVLTLVIPTLEGAMLANEGDWIIRGVKGELYPCKSDIFELTYEPVEE